MGQTRALGQKYTKNFDSDNLLWSIGHNLSVVRNRICVENMDV